jgi:hypothetical protein
VKKLIILTFFLPISLASQAQYSRTISYHPEMYVSIGGGLNAYMAEGFSSYIQSIPLSSFGTIGRASIGFRFSPFIGLRVSPGFAIHNWPDIRHNDSIVNFSSDNLTFDLMVNLSNALNYKQTRSFNFYLFVGTGFVFRNPSPTLPGTLLTPVVRGGLQGDISMTESIDLNLSGEMNMITDTFNGFPIKGTVGIPFDLYPALMVGLAYHFKSSKNPNNFNTARIVDR